MLTMEPGPDIAPCDDRHIAILDRAYWLTGSALRVGKDCVEAASSGEQPRGRSATLNRYAYGAADGVHPRRVRFGDFLGRHFEHLAVDGFEVEHRRRSSRDAEASQCYRDGKLRRHSKRLPDIQRVARAPAVYSVSLAKEDEGTVGSR